VRIDFKALETKVLFDFKGGEKELRMRAFEGSGAKLMRPTLLPGASIGTHTHTGNCEIFYIISGTGICICDGVEERMEPGICLFCPDGHTHSLVNNGMENLEFFAAIVEQ